MNSILPDDSPLLYPPRDLDPVQKAALDALVIALDGAWGAYGTLVHLLQLIGSQIRDGQQPPHTLTTAAITRAWDFVGDLWRLHQILRHTPGLERSPQLEVLLRALAEVEPFRHDVQHLEQRLRASVEQKVPIWGFLSWLWTADDPSVGGTIFAIIPGSVNTGDRLLADPLGKKEITTPVGVVTLSAFGREVELSELAARILPRLAAGLDKAMREAFEGMPLGPARVVVSIPIRFSQLAGSVGRQP